MIDGILFQEHGPNNDRKKDAEGEPEGDDWNNGGPVVVDDSFKHDFKWLIANE